MIKKKMDNLAGTKTGANLAVVYSAKQSNFWFEAFLTNANLKIVENEELFKLANMYKHMEIEALEEGFPEFAFLFKIVGDIEKTYKESYLDLLKRIKYYKSYIAGKKNNRD